jgi:pyruvate kinase
VIEKMTQIIKAVENSPLIQVPQTHHKLKQNVLSLKQFVAMPIMADAIKAKAICTLTNSGYAFQISAWRPSAHI